MVLGKLPVPGRPTIWITVGQGPTALAVCAGGSCLDIFTLVYLFFPLSPSLWETARYRLKHCFKRAVKPKTNQSTNLSALYLKCPMEFNHDTSQLCRTGHDDVSRTRMTTLAFILSELFPLNGFRCNFVYAP